MTQNLIDFVTKLTYKRNGKTVDSEDIIQEVFINLHLEGITEIEGNELRINHLIHYHLNKIKRFNRRFTQIDSHEPFDSFLDVETTKCKTESIETYYEDFKKVCEIREKDLELFFQVKFLNIPYKELCEDNGTNRKRVSRVYVKFKDFLQTKDVKLDSFYEE